MSPPNARSAPAHPAAHEEVIVAVVSGEFAADDPRAAGTLSTCPECARRVVELRAVAQALERSAALEREVLQEAASLAPDDRRAETFLRRRFAEQDVAGARATPTGRARARTWTLRLAAAAATVAAASWIVRLLVSPQSEAPSRLLLGDDASFEILGPKGEVEAFGTFRWRFDGPPALRYIVKVYKDAPDALEPLLEASVETGEWTPDSEQERRLPPAIRWEVSAYDRAGFLDSQTVFAQRLPR